jgi:hypothetical protein
MLSHNIQYLLMYIPGCTNANQPLLINPWPVLGRGKTENTKKKKNRKHPFKKKNKQSNKQTAEYAVTMPAFCCQMLASS